MEQLRKDGWHINESQTADYFDEGVLPKTSPEILKVILNEDLRNFGEASIINLHKKDESILEGPCVLQLLRYRNVSVPRIKEELNQTDPSHSIIRLFLTDGHTSLSALVLHTIPGINSDTPPGTKIQINGKIEMEGGNFLILEKKHVKILGGRVEEMIEKWNVEKSSVRADGFKSSVGKGTGAPKWVSFGKRGQKGGQLEKGFKANSVMPKTLQKEGDDADDFSKNRAEILKDLDATDTKTFAKPNLAPPPVKAPPPPKERREAPPTSTKPSRKGRGRKNSEDGPDVDLGEYANHKPSGPATLFDFIGGGGEKGAELVEAVTEKTAKIHVSAGGSGRGGGASRGGRKHGDRPPRNDRNDTRSGGGAGPSSKTFENPRGNHQDRPLRGSERGGNSGKFQNQQRISDRPTTQPPQNQRQNQQNRPQTGGLSDASRRPQNQPPHGNQNPRGNYEAQNFQPRGNENPFQGGQQQQQPPRGNYQNFQGGGQQQQKHPRGTQNDFQGGQQQPRGNYQQRFQAAPPRGNQNPFQGGQQQHPPRGDQQGAHDQYQPRGTQNDFQGGQQQPRGNYQQSFQAARGNQNTFHGGQQQQQQPRGNQQGGHDQYQPRGNYQNQQHQQQPRGNHNNLQGPPLWSVGAQCLATWTDGKLYAATIIELQANHTAVVRFNEYGTTYKVPVDFLILP
ncbi:Protein CBG17880 [Caenorhabditis briggsae]|uniref:Protein CBG17880 n=2 Tax=Caenorhabditis briggsae TaxID=6238 RepID=A8XS04_CAEBR|nr:Protein CBG17880 [Caenorhabditis briggsae]ULT87722.1 hypothetical protein L3Y34_007119 [Caenorhabditis briggsae]CAP35423.2 Protein CBG17880 [Caenorhabditis briggsae]